MPKNGFVQARVDQNLKLNIEALFDKLGLSMTDAITLFFTQCILCNGLPFSVSLPNLLSTQHQQIEPQQQQDEQLLQQTTA